MKMPEILIESVLSGKTDPQLLIRWLNSESVEDTLEDSALFCCSRSEFVAYFLSYLRNQTESVLQTNSNVLPLPQHQNTPEKAISTRRKHRRSTSDPTKERPNDRSSDSLSVKTEKQRSHESPSKDKKNKGRKVKTKLFSDESLNHSVSSDESRLCTGVDRLVLSSTPMKNGFKSNDYPLTSPVTPHSRSFNHERCDTPRMGRHSRSQEKSCLGDFLVTTTKSSKKKRTDKNVSNDSDKRDNSDGKVELDLSNSDMFPEIGARKASSLKSDRRRIKPTNLDMSMSQKSFSLNSFNSESFQQPSPLSLEDNLAFQQEKFQPKELSNSFDVERNMLKQERHKLMEKFNILNTNSSNPSPKSSTPKIKLIQSNSIEKKFNYVKADGSKVSHKEKINILVLIYEELINNNFILSVNTEIYFLISILLSKQNEDEYTEIENKLKDEKIMSYLLKSIHNSTYFAIKSLWSVRLELEMILDKNSLKILGENKKVRGFLPDLAKFLLNSYGIKCENGVEKVRPVSETNGSNSVVCFNFETDNTDNFPSVLSFQNFKKQRDMFYEIMRWYNETQTPGGTRSTFRARIKTLITCGHNPTNHSHLAALFTKQMLLDCQGSGHEESKLSKLQRRLTCPTAQESHRLPHFTAKEMFYKEFIMYAENESFRVHLRDALASEILVLDSTPLVNEDKNSNSSDTPKEFLQLSKKLQLLSRFLGYLTSLPYCQPAGDPAAKSRAVTVTPMQRDKHYTVPKEKVLENNITLRNYSQPSMDLKSILNNAIKNSRLTVTLPWIIHYLSMLDYSSLRIDYYRKLIDTLFEIHVNLKTDTLRKQTTMYLKSILGWLFDLPHFPQEFFYDYFSTVSTKSTIVTVTVSLSDVCVDGSNVVDEAALFELCPFLRDVNVLLSTCKVSQEKSIGTFRHITPVSFTLNPEDRVRSREKELQSRLEEQLVRTLPAATRRVLELVTERALHAATRALPALLPPHARAAATRAANNAAGRRMQPSLLQETQAIYNEELEQLRAKAMQIATQIIKERSGAALHALLVGPAPPLLALVERSCLARLARWLADHWGGAAVLCKDIESELKTLIALGPLATTPTTKNVVNYEDTITLPHDEFEKTNISIATTIINLKEHLVAMLCDSAPTPCPLAACAAACSAHNVFCRSPARHACMQLTLDLALVYVSKRPKEVTDELLMKFLAVWDTCCPDRKRAPPSPASPSPEPRDFQHSDRCPTPVSDDDTNADYDAIRRQIAENVKQSNEEGKHTLLQPSVKAGTERVENEATKRNRDRIDGRSERTMDGEEAALLDLFNRILCARNVCLVTEGGGAGGGAEGGAGGGAWRALARLLVFLLRHGLLAEDSLTEQCLALYRQDWPMETLAQLSQCMQLVSQRWSRGAGKFTLFLQFLAEYCGDMDLRPNDCI